MADDVLESEEENPDIPEMHVLFADWMRPSELGGNRETIELRWAGVAYLRDDDSDWEKDKELIRIALAMASEEIDSSHWFRQPFKNYDNLFPMTPKSNEFEIKTLAAACLAAYLEDEEDETRATALATVISAASFCGNRCFSGGADLLKMAAGIAKEKGMATRRRFSPQPPALIVKPKQATLSAVEAVVANQVLTIKTALNEVLGELTTNISSVSSKLTVYAKQVNSQRVMQDEELEILWWVFGEKSELLNLAVNEIAYEVLPFVLGREFSQRTKIDAEIPSLSGLLKKAGLSADQDIQFKDIVNKAKDYTDNLLFDDEYCPVLSPALYALSLTRENTNWQRTWEKNTGLAAKTKASSLDWALQIYREYLHIHRWG